MINLKLPFSLDEWKKYRYHKNTFENISTALCLILYGGYERAESLRRDELVRDLQLDVLSSSFEFESELLSTSLELYMFLSDRRSNNLSPGNRESFGEFLPIDTFYSMIPDLFSIEEFSDIRGITGRVSSHPLIYPLGEDRTLSAISKISRIASKITQVIFSRCFPTEGDVISGFGKYIGKNIFVIDEGGFPIRDMCIRVPGEFHTSIVLRSFRGYTPICKKEARSLSYELENMNDLVLKLEVLIDSSC